MPFPYGLPCMCCGKGEWEVIYDDGVMEYAFCKECAKKAADKDQKPVE